MIARVANHPDRLPTNSISVDELNPALEVAGLHVGWSSSNLATWMAGFALLALWVFILILQVRRQRRRQRSDAALKGSDDERSW